MPTYSRSSRNRAIRTASYPATVGPVLSCLVRLRVLSYNIHRAIGVDRRFRPERIASIIEHHDPDVVLLQEVDDGASRARGSSTWRGSWRSALDYPHYAIGHNVTPAQGPLRQRDAQPLPDPARSATST